MYPRNMLWYHRSMLKSMHVISQLAQARVETDEDTGGKWEEMKDIMTRLSPLVRRALYTRFNGEGSGRRMEV